MMKVAWPKCIKIRFACYSVWDSSILLDYLLLLIIVHWLVYYKELWLHLILTNSKLKYWFKRNIHCRSLQNQKKCTSHFTFLLRHYEAQGPLFGSVYGPVEAELCHQANVLWLPLASATEPYSCPWIKRCQRTIRAVVTDTVHPSLPLDTANVLRFSRLGD